MRNSKALLTAILMLTLSYVQLHAQEQLGLKLGHYSGINSVLINPTYQATSPFTWDVNLVSAGIFFDNNYAYIENASLIDVITNTDNIKARPNIDPESENIDQLLVLDYYTGSKKKQTSLLTTVMGPSVMINLESGFSFGLFTNFRTAVSARKIPASMGYYQFEDQSFSDNISVAPFKVAAMTWSEVGFNFTRQFDMGQGRLAVGGNIKMLNGYEAAYFRNKANFEFSRELGDSLSFQNLDAEFAFTNSNVESDQFALKRTGGGVGLDAGASYIDGDDDGDYFWKIGAAIIDVGRVEFTKSAERHEVNAIDPFDITTGQYNDLSTIDDQLDLFSLQALGDSMTTFARGTFKVWLPTAFTAYGDYKIIDRVYVNALLVQSIPIGKNAIARDNILALTPRYERRWISAMLPVSLYNYRKVRVGFSARLAFLTIGSDNLTSFFKQNEFTGSDFYVGIKINPFKFGFGGDGKGGNRPIRCYHF